MSVIELLHTNLEMRCHNPILTDMMKRHFVIESTMLRRQRPVHTTECSFLLSICIMRLGLDNKKNSFLLLVVDISVYFGIKEYTRKPDSTHAGEEFKVAIGTIGTELEK